MLNAAYRNEPSEFLSEANTLCSPTASHSIVSQSDEPSPGISPGTSSACLINSNHKGFDRAPPIDIDAWSQTLAALLQCSTPPEDVPKESAHLPLRDSWGRAPSANSTLRTFTVTVLERLAGSLVALSWHDPTLCNYEEQLWSPALAGRSGRCALSGLHISRGDSIYRPRARGGVTPLNADAMILASALPEVRDD